MSISILNRGASGGLTASIKVNGLGESDIVTASNGSKTKTGVWNTDGYHEINGIKDLGLWAVTATNGVKTSTQDVLIEVIGLYTIEMNYTLWLYREGEEFTDVTGGWVEGCFQSGANGYITKNETSMYVMGAAGSSNASCGAITTNKIDCSGYDTLFVEVLSSSVADTCNVYLTNNTAGSDSIIDSTNCIIKSAIGTSTKTHTITLDTSDVTTAYVWLASLGSSRSFTVSKVWLE